MGNWLIVSVALYLILLFGLAAYVERRSARLSKWVNNAYVYALSLGVYCTAWTFFGSVGRAAAGNLDFLNIYLGPTLVAASMPLIYRKILRICKSQRITTLPDFISTRYGKRLWLGNLLTLFTLVSIVPYIALQIKGIGLGYQVVMREGQEVSVDSIWQDPALYFTIALGGFVMMFATHTHRIVSGERNAGMVATIALESVVKLLAFLVVGVAVCMFAFSGWDSFWQELYLYNPLKLNENQNYFDWVGMLFLAAVAFLLLPRQFEMGIVENTSEKHLYQAAWLLPLYLLLINLFVVPIATAGNKFLKASPGDLYMILLPLHMQQPLLLVVSYLGGFSAATAMIIVSTLALSRTLSNHWLIPFFLRYEVLGRWLPSGTLLPVYARRLAIVFVLLSAYMYYHFLADRYALTSLGLISFAAMAQFAVPVLGGIYWRGGNRRGVLAGLAGGFLLWFYLLFLPSLLTQQAYAQLVYWLEKYGLAWLSPASFMGMVGYDTIIVCFFWSILLNTLLYVVVSLLSEPTPAETNQAEIFVNIDKYAAAIEQSVAWKGTAKVQDVCALLERFLGKIQANMLIEQFSERYQLGRLQPDAAADPRLITYAENILAGVIGTTAARLVISSVANEERLSLNEVVEILKESQALIRLNHELKRTTEQLKKATIDLQKANQQLKEKDEQKDEFLYTVTHELRTPLTSIKALTEILYEHHDLPTELHQQYLETMIRETERMGRLISQVLDLENFESGKHKLHINHVDMNQLLQECIDSMKEVLRQRRITLIEQLEPLPRLWVDRDLIIQVVLNLMSNAIKYCPEQNGKIRLLAQMHDLHSVRLAVGDNGPGVPVALRQVIFEKFFRIKNHTHQKPKGAGLGLAISRQIVQLHCGKIWVETDEQLGGALFCLTLPLNLQDYE